MLPFLCSSDFFEQIRNSSSYLSDSPTVHNGIQERINKNDSCHVVIGDFTANVYPVNVSTNIVAQNGR